MKSVSETKIRQERYEGLCLIINLPKTIEKTASSIAEKRNPTMKGTRPLNNDEIRRVSAAFTGTYEVRNRSLFMLGVSTGGRISELLGLQRGDVWQNDLPVTDLLFDRSIVKGGEVSRAVPVNSDGRDAIDALMDWHLDHYENTNADRPLFPSRNGKGRKALSRIETPRLFTHRGDSWIYQKRRHHHTIAHRSPTPKHSRTQPVCLCLNSSVFGDTAP